ncbi:MAG: hypothetical protein ABL921_07880 [Pirellula sp.]
MNHLIVVGSGLVGGAIGFAASATLAIWLANAKGVSSMEGAPGYLGMAAGMVGGLIALVLSMILALRLQGVTNVSSLIAGTLGGCLSIVVLAALAFGVYWLSVPKLLNRNGASPQMYFEINPPAGFEVEPSKIRASLNTNSAERPEVRLSPELRVSDDGQAVLSGQVELYYRASWRLIAVELPDGRSILFKLRFPADPTTAAKHRRWSEWYTADEVNMPGQSQAVRVKSESDAFKIRYRIEFWMEPRGG